MSEYREGLRRAHDRIAELQAENAALREDLAEKDRELAEKDVALAVRPPPPASRATVALVVLGFVALIAALGFAVLGLTHPTAREPTVAASTPTPVDHMYLRFTGHLAKPGPEENEGAACRIDVLGDLDPSGKLEVRMIEAECGERRIWDSPRRQPLRPDISAQLVSDVVSAQVTPSASGEDRWDLELVEDRQLRFAKTPSLTMSENLQIHADEQTMVVTKKSLLLDESTIAFDGPGVRLPAPP